MKQKKNQINRYAILPENSRTNQFDNLPVHHKKKSASKLYLLYNEPGTCVNVVKDRININYQRL